MTAKTSRKNHTNRVRRGRKALSVKEAKTMDEAVYGEHGESVWLAQEIHRWLELSADGNKLLARDTDESERAEFAVSVLGNELARAILRSDPRPFEGIAKALLSGMVRPGGDIVPHDPLRAVVAALDGLRPPGELITVQALRDELRRQFPGEEKNVSEKTLHRALTAVGRFAPGKPGRPRK